MAPRGLYGSMKNTLKAIIERVGITGLLLLCALSFAAGCVFSPHVHPVVGRDGSLVKDTSKPVTRQTEAPSGPVSPAPTFPAGPSAEPISPGPSSSAPPTGETASPAPDPSESAVVAPDPTDVPYESETEAVFLGVKDYGRITFGDVKLEGNAVYRFLIGGSERLLSIRRYDSFPIQNVLMEGHRYYVRLSGGEVVSARPADVIPPFTAVISGTPGKRTLRNFLATAMMPLGHTLYVYGGGWDWQDEAASTQAKSIGVSGAWDEFFRSQNANYLYKDSLHPESSTYPFGGWNEYYYAGLDCSGYLGWVIYNTFETGSGREGYVFKSTQFASTLDAEYGWGNNTGARYELGDGELRPGDIVSMKGHVWTCVGRCGDGSIVIIHSSPSVSVTGCKGGGVQLSALNPNGDSTDCEAYRLANYYQTKYFPEWAARYKAGMRSFSDYLGFERTGVTGIFRWDLSGSGLSDPDGFAEKSAAEILADLFGE